MNQGINAAHGNADGYEEIMAVNYYGTFIQNNDYPQNAIDEWN